jgi:energy-coupling factor transporter ATP-binding protein EcfA2
LSDLKIKKKGGFQMIGRLKEFLLPYMIKVRFMIKKEKLTYKERRAQEKFLENLQIKKRKTRKPVIVAMVGLVGSGKSSVARALAGSIGANVIEGDEIRVLLRKEGERYEGTRKIAENMALEIIKRGGNVIMDSDHVDAKKRASLRAKAKSAGVKLVFICTYSEDGGQPGIPGFTLDTMIGRNMTGPTDEFFGEAKTPWQGSKQEKAVVVKLREMIRRLPHHYRWENKGGGRWVIKNPPCPVLADINTADPDEWKERIGKLAKKILSF